MKRTKRIFAIFMTLALAMSMLIVSSAVSFAAEGDVTISVKEGDTHSYEAYQIFTANVTTKDGKSVLSNIKWGQNGTGTKGAVVDQTTLDALKALTGTDSAKAAEIAKYANLTNPLVAEIKAGSPATVAPGYYLIKDKTGATMGEGDEYTLYIVEVAENVVITRKAGTTESDKKIDDVNDSDTTAAADNGKLQTSSDYDIGDEVPYHVTAKISSQVGQYKKYHITLEDILESGKFDAITLDKTAITLGGAAIADTDDYTVTTTWDTEPTKDGFKVTYEFVPKDGKDLSSLAGKTIAINFTATLGQGAAIGDAGNRNTLKVKYSNNPNETDGHSEGTTPDKVVITFTYKVVVDKYDQDGTTPLENAGFTLYKVSKTDANAGVTGADADAKNAAWADKAIKTWTSTAAEGKTTGKNNRFSFTGIDDGYYVLCETTTPAGYNTMEPQVFQVTATHGGTDNNGLTLDTLSGDKVSGDITFTATKADGTLSTDISNKKGAELPETGGIGTVIFYVLGSLLVVGCGIVLISKRRMESR